MSPVLVDGGAVEVVAIDTESVRVAVASSSSASIRSEVSTVTVAAAPVSQVSVTSTDALPGPPGPAGAGAMLQFPFTTAATWTVRHNLGRYVDVSLLDDTGAEIDADVEQPDSNTVVVTHSRPITGVVLVG